MKLLSSFRPPSGNEFKNSGILGDMKEKEFVGFRPPSGNEFKN